MNPDQLAAQLGSSVLDAGRGPCLVKRGWLGELHINLGCEQIWQLLGLRRPPADGIVLMDAETTGLGSAAGVFIFLVGVARYQHGRLHYSQYLMLDPAWEPSLLAALAGELATVHTLVTFNGKAFDWPLLEARYVLCRMQHPGEPAQHLDLLHLARRLWRDMVPRCALTTLEAAVLGRPRSWDIPNHEVPKMYFAFLRRRDPHLLQPVLEHNRHDLWALAQLLGLLTHRLQSGASSHPEEMLALALLHLDRGSPARAVELAERSFRLSAGWLRTRAAYALARCYKRLGRWQQAVEPLQVLAQSNSPRAAWAAVELAKIFEHRLHRYREALHWVEQARRLRGQTSLGGQAISSTALRQRELRLRQKLARRMAEAGSNN